jgi:peptide/nickel transport system substrate-binding protein
VFRSMLSEYVRRTLVRLPVLLALLTAATLIAPDTTAQSGRGLIVEANSAGTTAVRSNPVACSGGTCGQINAWLYPTLFAVDPLTGAVIPAAEDNFGLAIEVVPLFESVQQIGIRNDLYWSDGEPITAYDVLFSMLAHLRNGSNQINIMQQVDGVRLVDTQTLEVAFQSPGCETFPRLNFMVLPAHIYDPGFVDYVDRVDRAENGAVVSLILWMEVYSRYQLADAVRARLPDVTAGPFELAGVLPFKSIHLTADDTAFAYVDLPSGVGPVEYFLQGETNVLVNPPLNRRADLRAFSKGEPGLQIAEYPNGTLGAIIFNFADPTRPRPAFDDEGQPRDQGQHPLFSDPAVRRAVQLALDVDEIIEAAFEGNALPLAANLPPTSWAYNTDLEPVGYDLGEARRILEAAGWKGAAGQTRVCRGCVTADEGTPLSFWLEPVSDNYAVGQLIARQLSRAGFSVNVTDMGGYDQTFDAYLVEVNSPYTEDPDQLLRFTRAGDNSYAGGPNIGSYHHPEVERLLQEARTLPGCDLQERAALYHEAQEILHTDQPYAWLYVKTDMLVARPSIIGFDPLPGRPYWNILDWVVLP